MWLPWELSACSRITLDGEVTLKLKFRSVSDVEACLTLQRFSGKCMGTFNLEGFSQRVPMCVCVHVMCACM